MLIFHIGLPKTATTFLQHKIFAFAENINFVHRKVSSEARALCSDLNTLAIADDSAFCDRRTQIRDQLREHAIGNGTDFFARNLLISDENISLRPGIFWTGEGSSPSMVANRLADVGKNMALLDPKVRVIIGIRRQDQWLASRYAESSKLFPEFGQMDFERRMADIIRSDRLEQTMSWLDYDEVYRIFITLLGQQNVLLVPMERLFADPVSMLSELGEFLDSPNLIALYRREQDKEPGGRVNSLSAGDNSWLMRRDNSKLHLPASLAVALRQRFAISNHALSQKIPHGFEF